ncbi:Fe(3+) ABC transporter substrate-binding protein [Thalassovita taeanensis]|uniref:Iron(III) transport system substrate-binding protein n=1 Tax=Thalassovita taeanensis TaxID=657014 RepID=A0A1H8YYI3_9RHOB|nr:Fe(3+) ABC transporter substrate-binding protein [Thalassovita taeanensis]SEP57259.1 iron(III) transport system substrate-binding protein [Thalassovita taeanensis]
MFAKMKPTAFALLAATIAAPALADEVNLYSYRQPELLKPLTDAFTAETGINVNVAYLEKGMIERLTAEGTRSPADLVLTVDIARLAAVVDAGLTQPVDSAALSANVPAAFHDPDGHWWGLSTRARVVYASKERVKPGDVTTYEDLADPKWKGRICTRSGTHAYNVALTAAVLHHLGEDGARAWLEGVKANLARKPQGNDRAQVKAIWAGECDIAIGNTYYMGEMLKDSEQKEWADSVNIVFPVFEGGGAHVNISGVAMTKAAPHRENALKMMEFLTSPQAQEIYAHANFEYPIAPGTEPDALVKGWGSFTPDSVNLMELAKLRPAALKLIEEVDFDG